MKKKSIIILAISGILFLIIGIVLLNKSNIIKAKSRIEIYDATYTCTQPPEKFYEDDNYIYSFPCPKSTSIYVKLEDGNKLLIIEALETKKVTIEELIDAGLEVIKKEK